MGKPAVGLFEEVLKPAACPVKHVAKEDPDHAVGAVNDGADAVEVRAEPGQVGQVILPDFKRVNGSPLCAPGEPGRLVNHLLEICESRVVAHRHRLFPGDLHSVVLGRVVGRRHHDAPVEMVEGGGEIDRRGVAQPDVGHVTAVEVMPEASSRKTSSEESRTSRPTPMRLAPRSPGRCSPMDLAVEPSHSFP